MADPSKEKLKNDGTNIAAWLQYSANFCGYLFRKYPSIELTGLLQYVVNQLKDGSSLDLLILRELIGKMAAIEIIEDLSDQQIDAQAGGESLRQVVSIILLSI